jgi:prepilin-type processing-associated H-X9-DG protein
MYWLVAATLLLPVSCCLLMLPRVQQVRDGDDGWRRSAASLQLIGLALRSYEESYHCLPPTAVKDETGRELYGWRVFLLPYLERIALYQDFRLGEAWDSPHNKRLMEEPHPYRPLLGSPDPTMLTRYQVFVGPGTPFGQPKRPLNAVPGNTILVVEAAEPVPWSKPADLKYDPAGPLPRLGCVFSKPVRFRGYELHRTAGFNVLFADGSVRFLRQDIEEAVLRLLITGVRNEHMDVSKLE